MRWSLRHDHRLRSATSTPLRPRTAATSPADREGMAYSLPSPPLQPRAAPPPPLPPPPFHDTTLTLALARQPLAWALPSPRPRLPADRAAFPRVRSSPTGDTPPCTECGKRFPSWKALFGHLRCHRERQWRGITPPPHFRHGAGAADQFTVQEREVATSLLMLAGARPGGAGKGKESLLGSASSSSTTAPATPSKCVDDYKCSVCNKGFASGRALGGHKRLHSEGARGGAVVAATSSRCSVSEEDTAATETALDLNLAPPGPPLPRTTNDQGGSVNTVLEMKLGC